MRSRLESQADFATSPTVARLLRGWSHTLHKSKKYGKMVIIIGKKGNIVGKKRKKKKGFTLK